MDTKYFYLIMRANGDAELLGPFATQEIRDQGARQTREVARKLRTNLATMVFIESSGSRIIAGRATPFVGKGNWYYCPCGKSHDRGPMDAPAPIGKVYRCLGCGESHIVDVFTTCWWIRAAVPMRTGLDDGPKLPSPNARRQVAGLRRGAGFATDNKRTPALMQNTVLFVPDSDAFHHWKVLLDFLDRRCKHMSMCPWSSVEFLRDYFADEMPAFQCWTPSEY